MKKASRHSLDRRPKKLRKKKGEGNGCFGNPNGVVRFDDACTWAVRRAFDGITIEANSDPQSIDWHYAGTQELLIRILLLLLAYEVEGQGNYAELFRSKRARLVVALVPDITAKPEIISVPDDGSPFSGETLKVHRVPILMAAGVNSAEKILNLTDERWETAQRKFSLPGKSHVKGPFLVVAAIDNVTDLTLRARMWPVWIEANSSTFAVVRSGYERFTAEAVHALGGVCFLPMHKDQLDNLQAALGSRWAGNLKAYAFLPDLILFPKHGATITVLEVFGLTALKKYAERKRVKEATAENGQSPDTYSFLAIQTRDFRSADPEIVILRLIAAWYRDEAKNLWRSSR